MGIHKIVFMASILILPSQALLAAGASHEMQVQPAATKAVKMMAVEKTAKPKHALPAKKQAGVVPGPKGATGRQSQTTNKLKTSTDIGKSNVSSDPVATPGPDRPSRLEKLNVMSPQKFQMSRLGPNLTVSVRYKHDVCPVDESPLFENAFDARCDVIVTVRNVGDTPLTFHENGIFTVRLWYTDHKGVLREMIHTIGNLAVNQAVVLVRPSSALRGFKRSTPFTAFVDNSFDIPESNENDNRAVMWLMN